MEKKWFVYILRCGDGSLYTGITVDVAHRLQMHRSGKGAKYTRGRGPLELVYCEQCETHTDALKREWIIKALPRTEKIRLIEGGAAVLQKLKEVIDHAENIVFFGGAGVSTGSGIPDFRGNQGLYTATKQIERPEDILSGWYLQQRPRHFFDYYRTHMVYPEAKPNKAHIALAELERQGKLLAVITQNIDGLHQMAGSRNVIELHGSVLRNHCMGCGNRYPLSYILESQDVPRCKCGGIVRPDVVLYGESLDDDGFIQAEQMIERADVLIVGGTSLTVYPAASLVKRFHGKHLIIVNKTPTAYDRRADVVIREPIENVF